MPRDLSAKIPDKVSAEIFNLCMARLTGEADYEPISSSNFGAISFGRAAAPYRPRRKIAVPPNERTLSRV